MPPYSSKFGGFSKKRFSRRMMKFKGRKPKLYFGGKASRVLSSYRSARNVRTGGLLAVEQKFWDTGISATNIPSSSNGTGNTLDPATVLCLNGVPQGDTASQRNGMEIAMRSLEIAGTIQIPYEAATGVPCPQIQAFVAVILDTQTNGAQADSGLCFINNSGSNSQADIPLRNMSYTRRFKVLARKRMRFNVASVAGYNVSGSTLSYTWPETQLGFKFFIPLKGLKTRFASGSSSGYVGTIEDNSIHVVAYCNDVSYAPTILYQCRLRYVD